MILKTEHLLPSVFFMSSNTSALHLKLEHTHTHTYTHIHTSQLHWDELLGISNTHTLARVLQAYAPFSRIEVIFHFDRSSAFLSCEMWRYWFAECNRSLLTSSYSEKQG